MDRSLFIFIAVGVGFLYFITGFVRDMQEEDERFTNSAYNEKHKYDKYIGLDAIGQKILTVEGQKEDVQIDAWQNSPLKKEFFEIFPDYGDMRIFVKDRIKGSFIQKKLLRTIDEVEGKFLSGTIQSEDAKQILDKLE